MKLLLERFHKGKEYTIGRLYIDGELFCNTLEDTDRELTQDMPHEQIKAAKVYGNTAIPRGTYKVTLNVVSPRFKNRKAYTFCGGRLPRLIDVPGFDGILIHIGNTPEDTKGCILVGWNDEKGKVVRSTEAFKKLYERLLEDPDNIEIEIVT